MPHRDGPFRIARAVEERADQQLGRLVLRLVQGESLGEVAAHRPHRVGGVGDPCPGECGDKNREESDASAAHHVLRLTLAQGARPRDEVGDPVDDRLQNDRQVIGVGLAVGVGGDEVARASQPGKLVAETQRRALSAVHGRDDAELSELADNLGGAVLLAVDDDEH